MQTNKKILIILCVLVSYLSLSGCGNEKEGDESFDKKAPKEQIAIQYENLTYGIDSSGAQDSLVECLTDETYDGLSDAGAHYIFGSTDIDDAISSLELEAPDDAVLLSDAWDSCTEQVLDD